MKRTNKSAKFKPLTLLAFLFTLTRERSFIKTRNIEIRFVTEPENILFAWVCVCNFQPGNFTGWGSEWVKRQKHDRNKHRRFFYFYRIVRKSPVNIVTCQDMDIGNYPSLCFSYASLPRALHQLRCQVRSWLNLQQFISFAVRSVADSISSRTFNPFTAPTCKIPGLNDARMCLQTVYFPALWHLFPVLCVLMKILSKASAKKL